jgi:signal peptidase I
VIENEPVLPPLVPPPGEDRPAVLPSQPPAPDLAARRRRQTRNLVEWVVVIAGALLVSLAVKTWLFQSFYIPSESMTPTLEINDRVIVNKLNDEIGDLARGDIVVFERPASMGEQDIEDLIKRVIAFPGESVEAHDGHVFIDGTELAEPWLPAGVVTADFPAQVIPDDHVWVMGDNRGGSTDSRVIGPIEESLLVGEAFVRIWPLDRLGGL